MMTTVSAPRGRSSNSPSFHVHRHHVLRAELALQDHLDSGFSMRCWMARFSGPRAEHRVEADLGQFGQGLRRTPPACRSIFSSAFQQLELDLGDDSMCFASSAWKTTISSMRFRNSGRKCVLHLAHTASLITS
jgi:hypothetical protein